MCVHCGTDDTSVPCRSCTICSPPESKFIPGIVSVTFTNDKEATLTVHKDGHVVMSSLLCPKNSSLCTESEAFYFSEAVKKAMEYLRNPKDG